MSGNYTTPVYHHPEQPLKPPSPHQDNVPPPSSKNPYERHAQEMLERSNLSNPYARRAQEVVQNPSKIYTGNTRPAPSSYPEGSDGSQHEQSYPPPSKRVCGLKTEPGLAKVRFGSLLPYRKDLLEAELVQTIQRILKDEKVEVTFTTFYSKGRLIYFPKLNGVAMKVPHREGVSFKAEQFSTDYEINPHSVSGIRMKDPNFGFSNIASWKTLDQYKEEEAQRALLEEAEKTLIKQEGESIEMMKQAEQEFMEKTGYGDREM